MEKMEMAIRNIKWRIEDCEKSIEEYRGRLADNTAEGSFNWNDSEFILSYASNLNEEVKKLRHYREQLCMLECLAKED